MKTITAKLLRDNLDEVVKMVQEGVSIRVTYRSKPAFIIQPDTVKYNTPKPGSKAAMKEMVALARAMRKPASPAKLDPHKSIKELYHEMLDHDPKYQSPHE